MIDVMVVNPVVNPMNDSLKQAYQGSVSAIIQVLNDHLSPEQVRTRAIFEGGVLQVLCEAAQPEQLNQEHVVGKVKSVLEDISPRNIRRVNINARIIQEHQLLWLEEIKQDETGSLWSQEILLARPHLMQHFFAGLKSNAASGNQSIPAYAPSSPAARKAREKQQFNRGLIGGLIGAGLLGLVGLAAFQLWRMGTPRSASSNPSNPSNPSAPPIPKSNDDYSAAVRLANDAAASTPKAQSQSDWQTIAEKWGKAADLMAKVPSSHPNYAIAQDRTTRYRGNQQVARSKGQ
jgi:hypothetical protein